MSFTPQTTLRIKYSYYFIFSDQETEALRVPQLAQGQVTIKWLSKKLKTSLMLKFLPKLHRFP